MIKYVVMEALGICESTGKLEVRMPAHEVMFAYEVRPEECVIFSPPYDMAGRRALNGLIVLQEQGTGVYDLSTCSRMRPI